MDDSQIHRLMTQSGCGGTLTPAVRRFAQACAALGAEVERERCAKLCEEVEAQAWALWKTTADPMEQGRNIGAQHCADAIRVTRHEPAGA
jgi:hypothetical protein